jgi:hypothetical protein
VNDKASTTPAELDTPLKMVQLVIPNPFGADPEHRENPLANLDFGPAGRHADDHDVTNITFRETEPGVGRALIRADHPLLPRLLEKYPQVKIGEETTNTVYLCSECDDGREFGSKLALRNHQRAHKAQKD